jgi:tRNA dimethylallyltransferase
MQAKLKYVVLAGPTAVGKTEAAIRVAQKLKAEIIGCDAFQIYRGLEILTAKPSASQLASARHHLIGLLPLTEVCDAHKYARVARQTIADLNRNGIVPLVVVGTGFYLQALEGAVPPLPAANAALRQELDSLSTLELLHDLQALDPVTANRIDRQNRRRIVRALEVCILSAKPFSASLQRAPTDPPLAAVLLERPRTELVARINRRVDEMFDQGVVDEVAAIESIGSTASQAIGFQPIRSLIAGTLDEPSCKELIKKRTRNYAKRQMTWFRRRQFTFVPAESSIDRIISALSRPLVTAAQVGLHRSKARHWTGF